MGISSQVFWYIILSIVTAMLTEMSSIDILFIIYRFYAIPESI